jgi:hypothetical protein
MSRSAIEIDKKFIEERSLQSLEELDRILDSDPAIIASMTMEEVEKELTEAGVAQINYLEEITSMMKTDMGCSVATEEEFDPARDIVRMTPLASYKVRARFKYLEPIKPKMVYEPLPDE